MLRVHVLLLPLLLLLCATSDASFAARKGVAKKKAKKAASGSMGGFGANINGVKLKTAATSGPSPAELLTRSIKVYEALERDNNLARDAQAANTYDDGEARLDVAPSFQLTKYCITLRAASSAEFRDWVPVALLALASSTRDPRNPSELVPSALGASVKEVVESACQNCNTLRKTERSSLEYSFEPLDSFESHVYDGLQGRSKRRAEAAAVLGVSMDASAADIKRAHRKFMLELHPDRSIGDEDCSIENEERMLLIQDAYAELGGGKGGASGSFYGSIGGKSRVDFSGPIVKGALAPLGRPRQEQQQPYEEGGWRAGVVPINEEITKEFVARNLVRSAAA
jgi:hypothetical protein